MVTAQLNDLETSRLIRFLQWERDKSGRPSTTLKSRDLLPEDAARLRREAERYRLAPNDALLRPLEAELPGDSDGALVLPSGQLVPCGEGEAVGSPGKQVTRRN